MADWIELNLLGGETMSVSITEVADELRDTPPDNIDNSEKTEIVWSESYQIAEHSFAELRSRERWLGCSYPIQIMQEVASIAGSEIARRAYRFLVFLRARQLYGSDVSDDGEEAGYIFEEFVTYAIGGYIGSLETVRFGVAGGVRGNGLPRELRDAVIDLARRMCEVPARAVSGHDDYRADAIAWKGFGDQRSGQIVLICQATIAEGQWIHKQPSKKWSDRRLVRFLSRPVVGVAFAETLSAGSDALLEGALIESVPFDRLRLLSVVGDDIPPNLLARMDAWVNVIRQKIPN